MLEPLDLKSVPFIFVGENWNLGSLYSVIDAGATEDEKSYKLHNYNNSLVSTLAN